MEEQGTYAARLLSVWPERALGWARRTVWPRSFALTRAFVAIGTLVTLVATPTSTLFYRSVNFPEGVVCGNPTTNAIALPCLMPGSQQGLMRLLMIAGLLLVLTGYLPRWIGLLHWYVTFSFVATSPLPDGGDHLALVITTLMLPSALVDNRRSSWGDDPAPFATWWVVAGATQFAALVQVMFVYLHAAIAKFGVAEWADGTALWYWSRHQVFGFPEYLRAFTDSLFSVGWIVGGATYGVLVLEMFLGLAVLMTRRWKALAMTLGFVFHLGIALGLGLISFAFSAFGLLVFAYGYAFHHELSYLINSRDHLLAMGPARTIRSSG